MMVDNQWKSSNVFRLYMNRKSNNKKLKNLDREGGTLPTFLSDLATFCDDFESLSVVVGYCLVVVVSNFVPCVVSVVDLVVKIVVSVVSVVVPLDVAVIVVDVVCVATLLAFVVISGTTAAVAPEEESSKSSKTELVLSPEIFSFSSFDFISNGANWGKSVAKTVDFERINS